MDVVSSADFESLRDRVDAIEMAFQYGFGVEGIDRDAVSRALGWASAFTSTAYWPRLSAEKAMAHEFAFILRTAANPVLGTVPELTPAEYFTREAFGKLDPRESAKFASAIGSMKWADFARSP